MIPTKQFAYLLHLYPSSHTEAAHKTYFLLIICSMKYSLQTDTATHYQSHFRKQVIPKTALYFSFLDSLHSTCQTKVWFVAQDNCAIPNYCSFQIRPETYAIFAIKVQD